ncbi:MAG TPA: type II toxin-antitoxin system VapC family toxin [Fimbriimonas sp.]|nr:type II toxin-antitoxin system VapC family toxin [Fimbriimonas sp.]
MILLDTHIWVWWVQGSSRLNSEQRLTLQEAEGGSIYVSAISLLEISRAVALGGMQLPIPTQSWFETALTYPGIRLIGLTPDIATLAYHLPEPFHKDPADRVIVATALTLDVPLMSADQKINEYPHIRHA